MEARTLPPPVASVSVKLIIGAFFTLLGVILTLDNLNVIDGDDYLVWWPAVLVVIGLVRLGSGARVLPVLLILAGVWLTAYNLEVVDVTLLDLWPVILIGVGMAMVARALGAPAPRVPDALAGTSTVWGVLSVRKVVETSRDFRGRRYVGFMGGCEIDLTDAEIAESPAVVETYAVWSSIEIDVPYHWEVVGEVVPIMGGFEVKLRAGTAPQKQLIIRGLALMAGVEVKSAPRRAA